MYPDFTDVIVLQNDVVQRGPNGMFSLIVLEMFQLLFQGSGLGTPKTFVNRYRAQNYKQSP
jgi:hypothetical protein